MDRGTSLECTFSFPVSCELMGRTEGELAYHPEIKVHRIKYPLVNHLDVFIDDTSVHLRNTVRIEAKGHKPRIICELMGKHDENMLVCSYVDRDFKHRRNEHMRNGWEKKEEYL